MASACALQHLFCSMSLACRKGIGEEEVGAEEFDEVLALLVIGGSEAGEDFPRAFAALRLVAAGELPGDDRGAEGSFGAVVGGLDAGMIEEGEEPWSPSSRRLPTRFSSGSARGGRINASAR